MMMKCNFSELAVYVILAVCLSEILSINGRFCTNARTMHNVKYVFKTWRAYKILTAMLTTTYIAKPMQATGRYDTIRCIYLRSKADGRASLI